MPYTLVYQLTYEDSVTGQTIEANITKASSFTSGFDPLIVVPLVGTVPPVRISVIDNDRNKFKAIRAKIAEFNLIPTTDYSASTFAEGPDGEWIVDITVQSTGYVLFKGFLVMDGHQKPLLPLEYHEPFRLTAADQLGTLKEQELTDTDGNRIYDTHVSKHSLLQYVVWALQKTGMNLNIVVCSTWFEESQTDFECAWQNLYPSHKAFETEINEKVDCYTALEMILKTFLCELVQRNGKWWIRSIDEPSGGALFGFEFDYQGTYVQDINSTEYQQVIGESLEVKMINEDQMVYYVRPHQSTRIDMDYQMPRELVDNIDFSRGIDDILPISVDLGMYVSTYSVTGDFPATGEHGHTYYASGSGLYYRWTGTGYEQLTGSEIPTGVAYVWENWTLERVGGGTVNGSAYIAKIFQFGTERERYGVLSISANPHRIVSNPIPVNRFDKIAMSVDRRLNSDISGSGTTTEFAFQLILEGQDGSTWKVDDDGIWYTNDQFVTVQYNRNSTDEREWMSASVETRPIPVNGNLYVALYQSQFHTSVQTQFANLQFNYQPYINGSYQRFKGHYNRVSQDGGYKAKIEETLFFGDSPRPIFKNSLFKLSGGNYVLTERWYAAGDLLNQGITPPIPDQYLHSLGRMQAFAYWNQYNRPMRIISGSLHGLRLNTLFVPDMVEAYTINMDSEDTDNKTFMMLSCDQRAESGEWSGEFAEIHDSVIGRDYDSPHEFKYKGGES